MALPASGAISFNAINVELGQPGTTSANLNQASYRTLAGVPSGTIALSNFYGKANQFTLTISSNQANYNLRSAAVAAGWGQSSKVVATISGGVYVYSTSTGSAGLTINGSWPGGVELVNNGYILGQGGNGGVGSGGGGTVSGSGGGLALSVASPVSITNNGTIGGGGGGGGGGGNFRCDSNDITWGGGGGGGGQTGLNNSSGGAAGPTGNPNSRGATGGGAGTVSGGGGGGQSAAAPSGLNGGSSGGSGGSWGSSGASGNGSGSAGGGSGGAATSGAPTYVTWVATGTRYGSIG